MGEARNWQGAGRSNKVKVANTAGGHWTQSDPKAEAVARAVDVATRRGSQGGLWRRKRKQL